MELAADVVNTPPARLLIGTSLNKIRPPVQESVPELSSLRANDASAGPVSISDAVDATTSAPLPETDPPAKPMFPWTLRSPGPLMVPPEKLRDETTVVFPASVSVGEP